MGIHTKIDMISDADVNALTGADAMLAKVLADFAVEKAEEQRRKNKDAIGGLDVPYIVEVNATLVPASPNMSPSAVKALIGELAKTEFARDTRRPVKITFTYQFPTQVALLLFPFSAIGVPLFTAYRALWASIGGRFAIRALEKALYHASRGKRDPDESGILMWIAGELRDRSPVYTGAYRDAHVLLGDGREVANAQEVAAGTADIPEAKQYSFTNPVPYARKIEIGKTKTGRDFVVTVQNHIYERVAKDAASKFSDVAQVSFSFERSDNALRQNQPSRRFLPGGRSRVSPSQRSDRAAGAPIELPTITVRLR